MKTFLLIDTDRTSGLTTKVCNEIQAESKEAACRKFGVSGNMMFSRMSDHCEYVYEGEREVQRGIGLIVEIVV